MAIDSLVSASPPLVIRRIIDEALPRGNRQELVLLAVSILGLYILDNLLMVGTGWTGLRIGNAIISDLRVEVFEHVQRLPISFHIHTQAGALQSRLMGDVRSAQLLFTTTLSSLVSNLTSLITVLVVMFLLSWQATVVVLCLVPLLMIPAQLVGAEQRKRTREQLQNFASLNAFTTERFNAAASLHVHLHGTFAAAHRQFEVMSWLIRDLNVRIGLLSQLFAASMALLAAAGLAAVYLVGGYSVIAHTATLGTVVALAAYLQRAYAPIRQLASLRVDIMTGLVAFERVFEILDLPSSLSEPAAPVARSAWDGGIDFLNVSFRYPSPSESTLPALRRTQRGGAVPKQDDFVLRSVSFACKPASITAIVGPSGSGKTTAGLLVPRLYDATEGTVAIDGVDVRQIASADLRRIVTVLTQDVFLFNDTLAANLRGALEDATDAQLEDACEAACLGNLVRSLPDGYATVLGDRGYRLSGGEKQRLAIARLLLRDPIVAVLDEPTAHLDYETEREVQDVMRRALSGRTALVIAHRLSTVMDADQIVVLSQGRVAETGTHEELIGAGGLYSRLYGQEEVVEMRSGPASPTY